MTSCSAMEEAKFTIAQANATVDSRLRLTDELVSCRKGGNFVMTTPDQVQFAARDLDPGTAAVLELRATGGRR